MTAMGQLATALLPRLSDRYFSGKAPFAGGSGSDGLAPTTAVRLTIIDRLKSTPNGHCGAINGSLRGLLGRTGARNRDWVAQLWVGLGADREGEGAG